MENEQIIPLNRSNLFRSLVFVIILCLVLSVFFKSFRFKYGDGIYDLDKFYELEDNTVDVLVLGSSHAFMSINPAVLYSEYGIAAYDLCGSVQPLWNTYHYLVEALKTQSPKLVVLESYCVNFTESYSDESRIVKNTFGLTPSMNLIDSLLVSAPKDQFFEYLFRFYRYHSRYSDLSASDFQSNLGQRQFEDWKGFGCNFAHTELQKPDITAITNSAPLSAKSEEYYRRILALCVDNGITLEVVVSPYKLGSMEQMRFNRAKEIAQEYDVPFTNYNEMYHEIDLDFLTDMADSEHLNHKGNIKYSNILGERLTKAYSLPDRRGMNTWASWEKNADYFWQSIENQKLKEQQSLNDYLNHITMNPTYTMVLSIAGNCSVHFDEISNVLKDFGIDTYLYDLNGTWVIENGQVINAYTEDTVRPYIQLDEINIDFSQGNVIMMNGVASNKVANGINILVYDHRTGLIADVAGFNAMDELRRT